MVKCTSQAVIFLLWLLCACLLNQSVYAACDRRDQEVLLQFKRSLLDPSNLLSSWSSKEDCCRWSGVHCHKVTGRVTKLDLSRPYIYQNYTVEPLTGEINLCLLELEFLNYLDLSYNNFTTIHDSIPDGQRNKNLSIVTHPHPSTLHHLDLSANSYLQMHNLRCLSHIPSLKYLDLSGNNLSTVPDLFQSLTTMFPSLSELQLSFCQLSNINPSLGYVNFSSLSVLDLSDNYIHSRIPNWMSNLSDSLAYLDLIGNELYGTIPEWLGQFKHLHELHLSYNSFQGLIPPMLGNMSSLTFFDVSHNYLNGSLPEGIGQLSNLETLNVAGNSLAGVLFETHFANLSNLKVLDLRFQAFQFDLGSEWVPPFQLQKLYLRSCLLGPKFPTWLYTQNSLIDLDVSSSRISFIDHPDKLWSIVSDITGSVDLSNNSISGDISNQVLKASVIDLSSNNIIGELPRLTQDVRYFLVGNNSFSGPTSSLLCDTINKVHFLECLDMSHNLLSGELPDCWMNWQYLNNINLGGNKLTGKIPHSLGSLSLLEALHLHSNNLFGDVPLSLQNCMSLVLLDLGENKLSGSIPIWINQNIGAIRLRSNQFTGIIPSQICQFSSLIILDLADNRLFGKIPKCLHNISYMSKESQFFPYFTIVGSSLLYEYSATLLNKGQKLEYQENLPYVRLIDISSNNLSGSIPLELFGLAQLNILNLSHNHLVGRLPQEIGNMKSLESLDLSRNELFGKIPQTISNLSFLSYLNFSYNNLSGKIPSTTQLQSFSALSYVGNHELCGSPLTNNCTQQEGLDKTNHIGEDDNQSELLSYFYIGMGIGFAIGFWGVCAMIFFNRACRHAYFRFLDHLKDQFISWCS